MSESDRNGNGRFAAGNKVRKAKAAPGSDGVVAYGGYIQTGESSSRLQGQQKWIEYANAYNRPPVAIAALLRWSLFSGVKWTLAENESGGAAARRGLEIVDEGLLKARMPEPWSMVVPKAAMSYFNGFSLHATAMGRRKDGLIVFTELAHRPAYSIERWLRSDDKKPFEAVEQRTNGDPYIIPLSQCLYLRHNMLSDMPDGVGVLRLIVERIRRADNYENLEGSEMFSSMGGMPIARAPLEEINDSAKGRTDADAYKSARTAKIYDAVRNRIKTPERQQWLALDSATYQGTDPNTISGIKKWDVEILKGDIQGLAEIRKVITDLDLDIARILGVEVVFVGGNDSAGSFGMHESKVGMLTASLQSTLNEVAVRAEQQLARMLVKANGLDPDDATPRLIPEKLTIGSVLTAIQVLTGINLAGLHPTDPARAILRERIDLPPEPEEALADLAAPRATQEKDPKEDEHDDVDAPKEDEKT